MGVDFRAMRTSRMLRRGRCSPCLSVGKPQLVAVLYLENDLVSGAFTRERLLALELLATQTAISLENALLLEAEHRARVEAEAAAQRAQLLGEATALMSSKVDSEGAFLEVARLCSRWFADWTMIDIEVDGEVERLASAHRDAEKDGLLRELAQKYPARAGTPTIVRRVLETGLTVSVSGVTDEQIRAQCVDDRHAELHRLVGTRSGVSVPLVARDHLLGALTFASSLPYRFGPADIELAEELGRRTALALDNVRLLEQTGRALRLREEFLALASHELRTPLTSLRLSVQQLQRVATGRAVSPEALASNLDRILRRTDRLEQLAGELLDVMRIYKGGLELQYAETDLEALVRGVVTRFEREMAAARCAVSIECARPVVGKWDRARIRQVVSQLLGNAIKFSAGRPVEIHIDERDGLAQLRVIDHGIGIERARLRHLFERFERGVSSTHYGGLGLGLYLARSIVRAHGGTIAVESEPGVGSTFTVVLPEAIAGRSGQADRRLPARDAARRELGVPEVRTPLVPASPGDAKGPVVSATRFMRFSSGCVDDVASEQRALPRRGRRSPGNQLGRETCNTIAKCSLQSVWPPQR